MTGVPPATLAVLAIVLPLLGAAVCFLVPRAARQLGVSVALATTVVVVMLVLDDGTPLRYRVGGWGAPLGVDLKLDGLALFMLLTTALTGSGVSVHALRYFSVDDTASSYFWPLWLVMWAALNALYQSADMFNLYVTLELMGLSAVALVALAGGVQALAGAMRYLLVTMAASLFYLLGVGLLYHQSGVLDIVLLGRALDATPAVWVPLGLVTMALLVKSALFPLHFWLPSAHASAPAPVSAVLSALVVKATLYMLLRFWLELMPADRGALGPALAALGVLAILWGSFQALRQQQLKLLVAYSTVAQIGYLFLPFGIGGAAAGLAWRGALYFVLCHALAKAAMFLAVGNFSKLGSTGRLSDLHLVAYQLPVSLFAFGVAGVTIIGLPPSGGFVAKWMLIEASILDGQWWLTAAILGGGLLSAAYVFKVLGRAFIEDAAGIEAVSPEARPREWVVLVLALGTLLAGFTAVPLLDLIELGEPFGAAAGFPAEGAR